MNRKYTLILLFSALFSGCATKPVPQSAEEFRQAVETDNSRTVFETYEVNRSYQMVMNTLEEKTKECFNKKSIQKHCIKRGFSESCNEFETIYHPTIIKNKVGSEFYVQIERAFNGKSYNAGNPPPKGSYVGVFDIKPHKGNKTTVTAYGASKTYSIMPNAVKHWAKGKNLGCPDFTQGY